MKDRTIELHQTMPDTEIVIGTAETEEMPLIKAGAAMVRLISGVNATPERAERFQ